MLERLQAILDAFEEFQEDGNGLVSAGELRCDTKCDGQVGLGEGLAPPDEGADGEG